MAPYPCPNCRRLLHFEARVCPACTATLGYDPASDGFLFLADQATTWRDVDGGEHDTVVCANNNDFAVCNWLVSKDEPTGLCRACRHNRTIPDLTAADVPQRWGKIEAAKRRLFHTLLHLGVPLETPTEAADAGAGQGLIFDFLYDPAAEETGQAQVLTGHDAGLVTLNLIEADDAERERIRHKMGEPYRTLLGHFRHEVGHHYWARLAQAPDEIEGFRAVFGDERQDYGASLNAHYGDGGTTWTDDYVSVYATSHPWEDFAETFAHYLHMVDALATIKGFGMSMAPEEAERLAAEVDFDPYHASTEDVVGRWVPFSFAENAIARSMGQPDLYPFHISPAITAKLDYVNQLLKRGAAGAEPAKEAVAA